MKKTDRVSKDTEREARAYLLDEGTPPGTTVRISHGECGDTRRRLYITTHDTDGSAVMWCHNCSKWGRVPRHGGIPRPPKKHTEESKLTMSNLKFVELDKAPPGYQEYVKSKTVEPYTRQIMWETTTGRLAYPIHKTGSLAIAGWQLRGFAACDIKYLTIKLDKTDTLQYIMSSCSDSCGSNTLVITEDLLSAAKCRYAAMMLPDALPLLGTYLHATTAVK